MSASQPPRTASAMGVAGVRSALIAVAAMPVARARDEDGLQSANDRFHDRG